MKMNLVLVTGLACGLTGGLVMFGSHGAIYRTATHIIAGYPRVLAGLRAKRHDGRFGFCILACGIVLQALGASGYSAPLSQWRYPTCAMIAALLLYCAWRALVYRRPITAGARQATSRTTARGLYETRRSLRLLEAARLESANLEAMERARAPRDTGVVYLARDWERRRWSEKFGVSADVLKTAVRYAGPMVEDIERYLACRDTNGAVLAA